MWNPQQYNKFTKERDRPFYDLLQLVVPTPDMTVVDLGCGTGKLTKVVHQTLKAKATLGIDASEAMLQEARGVSAPGLAFKLLGIEAFAPREQADLLFSNAALQWLPDHRRLLTALTQHLAPVGQIAIQMPANFDAASHIIAAELAREEPYKTFVGEGLVRPVLEPIEYAQLLYDLGFVEQSIRLQVYPVVLESAEGVVDWVKGSLLTYYQSLLPAGDFATFLTTYRQRVLDHYGDARPLFFPFKRILMWGRRQVE